MMLNLHFYSYDKRNGSKKLNSRFILLNVTFFTKSRFLKVQQLEHFFPENVLEIKLINLSR